MTGTVMITTGGTGGHVFPGLAVAAELVARGWGVFWLGTREGMEAKLVPQHGVDFEAISFRGVRGKGIRTLLLGPFALFAACLDALRVIRRRRPNVVLGFGGFASFPGALMGVASGRAARHSRLQRGGRLLGVALFHAHTLKVALSGLVAIALFKILFSGFKSGPGVLGFASHLGHEWVTLANLFGLLMGFALLSRHFEKSHVPVILPKYLPDDWKGAFVMLVMVFVLSSFLDNIAAALIGGAMAHQLFRAKVHIGYLAAIVAASNAGGAGSVVGDTTTTMLWIAGRLARPGARRLRGLLRRARRSPGSRPPCGSTSTPPS